MEGQWKGIVRTIHNRENNGEGQRTGGTKEWRTMERKDKGMEGQWKEDKGIRGQRDKRQRTGGTKDWRTMENGDKGIMGRQRI